MPLHDTGIPTPPTQLVDGQWRLIYPGTDLVFGDKKPFMLTGPPDLGDVELTTQDQPQPSADGVLFGRDYRGGRTIALPIGVHEFSEAAALTSHNRLMAAWRADRVRGTPGEVAALYARRAGRERVIYGRPRRFASELHPIPSQGYSAAQVDFAAADDLYYDAAATSITLGLVPPTSGGVAPPLTPPFSTVPRSTRPGLVSTSGLVDTWPVVMFTGPVLNPAVQLTGLWSIQLDIQLAYDQSVTIDTRPWARTVLRNDGANLAGALGRFSAKLSAARIPPGVDTEVLFTGVDATGTSRLTIAWQNAWPHL